MGEKRDGVSDKACLPQEKPNGSVIWECDEISCMKQQTKLQNVTTPAYSYKNML
jgi:hypothetical protein